MSLYTCQSELLSLCKVTDAKTWKEQWLIDIDKLGTTTLAVDKALFPTKEEYGRAYNVLLSQNGGEFTPLTVPAQPIFNYNKEQHGHLELWSPSTDPTIEYPESLTVRSLHRFSSHTGGTMPPLKGVKTLHVGSITCSLDFSATEIENLIVDRVSFGSKFFDDFRPIFPKGEFHVAHMMDNCTIKVNGHIEVGFSDSMNCYNLHYDCRSLTVKDGKANFSSSCQPKVESALTTQNQNGSWSLIQARIAKYM